MIGVEERETKSGIHVTRVHYTADPDKRSEEWMQEAERGFIGGRKGPMWRREMEIDWTVASGLGVYSQDFVRDWHVAKQPIKFCDTFPVYRGHDLGPTHTQPACTFAQKDSLGRLQVIHEMVTWNGRGPAKTMDIERYVEWVVEVSNEYLPGCEFIDFADPAAWSVSQTDLKSAVMILNQHGLHPRKGAVTMTDRKRAMQALLRKSISGGPALIVSPKCNMVIEGFEGAYRYEQIGDSERYKPTVEKNAWSHVMNSLEYVVSGLYTPNVGRDRDDDQKKRREPRHRDMVTGY